MFITEIVDEKDSELFMKIRGHYFHKYSVWHIDREHNIIIICVGKHGVETPVVFKMIFENHAFEFYIPEPDILYSNEPFVHVSLPARLAKKRLVIENEIKRCFRETGDKIDYGSLPNLIDNHKFEFEIIE